MVIVGFKTEYTNEESIKQLICSGCGVLNKLKMAKGGLGDSYKKSWLQADKSINGFFQVGTTKKHNLG